MKKKMIRSSAAIFCALLMTAAAPSTPEKQEFVTAADTPLSERLMLPDCEGVYCHITTMPVKGTLYLSSDGSFIYSPDRGRRGRDYFGYRVVNADGESSEEATVNFRINRPSS